MIGKYFEFNSYKLGMHIYPSRSFFLAGFFLDMHHDKWNGQRLHFQLIGLGWHFSIDLYSPLKKRIKIVQ